MVSVNRREHKVLEKYLAEGWQALRNGEPDFLFFKTNTEGNISEVLHVEVKPRGGRLTFEQEMYKQLLEKFYKAKYKVEVI